MIDVKAMVHVNDNEKEHQDEFRMIEKEDIVTTNYWRPFKSLETLNRIDTMEMPESGIESGQPKIWNPFVSPEELECIETITLPQSRKGSGQSNNGLGEATPILNHMFRKKSDLLVMNTISSLEKVEKLRKDDELQVEVIRQS